MGCLNSEGKFEHWFGNIHLSGPCNRACYFCIGQHMMALDSYNNLNKWPLDGLDEFKSKCDEKKIKEINLTGTNTDPLLFKHTKELRHYFRDYTLGIRTNAVLQDLTALRYFDKGSVTICSFDPIIYKQMMGKGEPPNIYKIFDYTSEWKDLKINIVLGPENTDTKDLFKTIVKIWEIANGVDRFVKINLREPYGQPRIGNPSILKPSGYQFGMPFYELTNVEVTYWDVHYVEVESVNLYANGRISLTYPITKGHSDNGVVLDQSHFLKSGRIREQWLGEKE